MKIVELNENQTFQLEPNYVKLAKELKLVDSTLPFSIEGALIVFSDYTVGELQLDDLLLKIIPRNPAFTARSFFEIITYLNSPELIREITLSDYDLTGNVFSLSNISEQYSFFCRKLLQYGLTGSYYSIEENSQVMKGKIVAAKYNKLELPFRGIRLQYQNYNINSLSNQIIKSALIKLLRVDKNDKAVSLITSVLREFDEVEEYEGDIDYAELSVKSSYSSNKYYSICLEYAIKILKELHLEISKGKLKWYAFLENSNDLFEKYVRKVLEENLEDEVCKWKQPQMFGSLKKGTKSGFKSYQPDILINYSETSNTSSAVLDAKNKYFNPNEMQLPNLVSNNDLYQIIFYCTTLKSRIGGLIYPAEDDYEFIKMDLSIDHNLKLWLCSINMKKEFYLRNKEFIKKIKEEVLAFI